MINNCYGKIKNVKIVSEGLSEAGNLYSAEVLKEAVAKFRGAPVYDRFQTQEEMTQGGLFRPIEGLCGYIDDVNFVDGTVWCGKLRMIPGPYADEIAEGLREGKRLRLRIDVTAETSLRTEGDEVIRVVDKILEVNCVVLDWMPESGEEDG